MSTQQDELFTIEDLAAQIRAHEGVTVHMTIEPLRFIERRYQDVYPIAATGTPHERATLVKERLLHMVRHYHSHAKKYRAEGKQLDFTAKIELPKAA